MSSENNTAGFKPRKSFNVCTISGNVCTEIKLEKFPSGSPYTRFRLAINDVYKDKESGEIKAIASFVTVKAVGKKAEVLAQYVGKGDELFLQGELRSSSYEKNGENRSEVYLQLVEMRLPSRRNGERSESRASAQPPPMKTEPAFTDDADFPASDVPF